MPSNDKEQFDKWCNDWEEALKTKDFQTPEFTPAFSEDDYVPTGHTTAQDDYWNHVEQEILHEVKTPNPIRPDTAGKDQDQPKPVWVNEKFIEEITELKSRLYKLEVKMNKKDAGKWTEKAQTTNGSSGKLLKELESMRKKIDELSNNLGTKEEPDASQWNAQE